MLCIEFGGMRQLGQKGKGMRNKEEEGKGEGGREKQQNNENKKNKQALVISNRFIHILTLYCLP